MMPSKKIVIYPYIGERAKSNYFLKNLCETLIDDYELISFADLKGSKRILDGDVYHFNWFESVDSKSFFATMLSVIKKRCFILWIKLNKKKIVWTVHNKIPHDSQYRWLSEMMVRFMAKHADKIHVLCKGTTELKYLQKYDSKIVYIPHGDYIGDYPKCNIDIYHRYNIPKEKKIALFVGQVRRYKNIDVLIDAFACSKMVQAGFVLLVCGACKDKKYAEELKSNVNSNVFFDFKFIEDNEMEAYLRACSFVVAPYDIRSSLNSGTLWMAMSYKRTMVLPLIECVEDFDYRKCLYTYRYSDVDSHIKELGKKLNDVCNEAAILDKKGKLCYDYIKTCSWDTNQEKWVELFRF